MKSSVVYTYFFAPLLVVLFLLPCLAVAQSPAQVVHLAGRELSFTPNYDNWLDSIRNTPSGAQQVYIQFSRQLSPKEVELLPTYGFSLQQFISSNTYRAVINYPVDGAAARALPVYSILPLLPSDKALPTTWAAIDQQADNEQEWLVSVTKDITKESFIERIAQLNGTFLPHSLDRLGIYKVRLKGSAFHLLAEWYGVMHIDLPSKYADLDVDARGAQNGYTASLPVSLGGRHLLGDSMVVGVGDNTSGMYHIDTKDRVINYNPAGNYHHGQHINGIVGSAGIIDPLAEGAAPHSILVDHLYDNVWVRTDAMFQAHHMTITNNSYAVTEGTCSYSGLYDINAQNLDALSQEYNKVLHVFAAGNDGLLTCHGYPTNFGTISGGYQAAKNVLTVTSTDKEYKRAYDASHGPLRDGRLKPEIAAVGYGVFSDIGTDNYLYASGTSMASPNAAGSVALLAQRYKQLHGNQDPTTDILKTLIMNGATDIGNPGPDFRFGFGFLNLGRSLLLLDSNRYIRDSISNGVNKTYTIQVPSGMAQMKVMLYWHDALADLSAAHQLVDDLDLEVTDPLAQTHLPLVLDTLPANVDNLAIEGEDHLNNCEQVTIENPAAGSYTILVKGGHIVSDKVYDVVAYDFIPKNKIHITYPIAGTAIKANNTTYVYWECDDDTHTFTLQYSTNNGSSWTTIDNIIPANQKQYRWTMPNLNTSQLRYMLTRNGVADTTGAIIANTQPRIFLDSVVQCPGYVRIHWDTVANATAYQILRKKGRYMQPIDTVALTTFQYTLSGLSVDSIYYVAVCPLFGSQPGYRSLAVKRQPNTGNCSGSISDGDIMAERIIAPVSGRLFTSSQLTASDTLKVRVRNLDDATIANYDIGYSINGGAWVVNSFSALPANNYRDISIAGLDLSAVGAYFIKVYVRNISGVDAVRANDTVVTYVRQLSNTPVNINTGFTEDFEGVSTYELIRDTIGITPNNIWDYSNTADSGRIRSNIDNDITISGNRSMSMDVNPYVANNVNYLTGTINLDTFRAANNEVRMEFDYRLHGKPKYVADNEVFVRGNDTQPWVSVYHYDTVTAAGTIIHTPSLSVTDALHLHGQDFSTSFQVRFAQHDTSVIASSNYGNGVTIDNIKLYTVLHDVQLTQLVSPAKVGCSLSNHEPVTVQISNTVNDPVTNVRVYYQVDNGLIYRDSIASIAGKTTISYTFPTAVDMSALGAHYLSVWVSCNGDTYRQNDSMMHIVIRNEPLINTFPYLQNFESDAGYWYTDGMQSSWQYGTPASQKINRAASGTKAWKTNLKGNYKNGEFSFLYSPCYNISTLSHPMLSMSIATEIENCGSTLCDGAYVEYSYDGQVWTKLGSEGQGTNWYNDSTYQVWSLSDVRWRVASIPLPASTQPIRLRVVLKSDPGVNLEGVAIDDIHIYDKVYSIYNEATTGVALQIVSGTAPVTLNSGSNVLGLLNPQGQDLGSTELKCYNPGINYGSDELQYYISRNYTVTPQHLPTDSVMMRLYITDSEVVRMVHDTQCVSCHPVRSAYELGVTQYEDRNKDYINGTLADNFDGKYSYYPYSVINWIPYDNGYIAQLKVKSFSEFWFNDGGPTHAFPVTVPYVNFTADLLNDSHADVHWTAAIDSVISKYVLYLSYNDTAYVIADTFNSRHNALYVYSYLQHLNLPPGGVVYYKLKYTLKDGSEYYAPTRKLQLLTPNELLRVYPNPTTNGIVTLQYTAYTGSQLEVRVTDLTGRQLFVSGLITSGWDNTTTVRVPKLPTGLYLMHVRIDGNTYVQKLIFE
jgi:Subtilase family/Secretion system C-terminal sorting domain